MKRLFLILSICLISSISPATILLHDTWADGSRLETNLPTESGFWASSPADVAVSVGSVKQTMAASSRRLHTYFAPADSPASLGIGEKLIATIEFTPRVSFRDSTSRNFRFGLFYDAVQHAQDSVGDSGISISWTDATGYAVAFSLSSTTASTIQIGKRTSTTDTLLGATGAYVWSAGGGRASNLTLDTLYTMTMVLDYRAANEMLATFTFANAGGVIASETLLDNGLGSKPIYTNFDFLLFRLSANTGTADVVDFNSIRIEYIPEPATMALLGLGGLLTIRRKR